MAALLRRLWNDEALFRSCVRAVAVALALGMSTAAGAEVLRHLGIDSPEIRLLIVMVTGGAGSAIPAGQRNT